MTPKDGLDIDHSALATRQQRNNFEFLQKRFGFCWHLRLNCTDHHILPALATTTRFIEKSKCLPHTRSVAEHDFQMSGSGCSLFFGFALAQEFLRRFPSQPA